MEKYRLKIIITIIIIVVGAVLINIFNHFATYPETGSITVNIIDESGISKSSKVIEITGEQGLLDLLKENYEITGTSQAGGFFLKSIDGIYPPTGYFFCIFVNGEMANVGISLLRYKDQDVITFRIMKLEG